MPSEVLDLLRCSLTVIEQGIDTLRRRLNAIERSADTLSVHLASERAQGVVEALEVLKVLKPADIETLYLVIEDAVQARVKTLML